MGRIIFVHGLKFKGYCWVPPHQTLVAIKGEVLYGIALLFIYDLDHRLLILVAGTFTGFVEAFVQAKGVVNFSTWTKRISGMIVTLVGTWFI